MVLRKEYRACLKRSASNEELNILCEEIKHELEQKYKGEFIEVMIYRHNAMLFLYFETRKKDLDPEEFLTGLSSLLETWPEETGLRHWAYMYPVFYQSIPKEEEEWVKDRNNHKERIGRIAFLKEEKLFSYVYWHKDLVDEGLLKGDKYQYISLHENILFSYYEEPRCYVNISGKEENSKSIEKWLELDPGSHFQLEKTEGQHFLVLKAILAFEG